jgi:hypothetical protein
MADVMERFIVQPIERQNVAETSKNMSWDNYAYRILNCFQQSNFGK